MNNENFSDAVLVVFGHGTTQNANSAAPVYQHAAELRRRKIFAGVREAFWKQEPQIKKVLPEISAARVFIVPLFISEGYFSGEVIPRELGFTQNSKFKTQNSEWFYCRPVGTHNRMTEVLLARAGKSSRNFRSRARPSRRTSRCSLPATARKKMKIRGRPSSGRLN